MTKCVRDGKVAVLYSPKYGAGWSTWNSRRHSDFLLHDEKLVELVESNQKDKIEEYIEEYMELTYPGEYIFCRGSYDLQIQWIPVGTRFRIEEYDGSERVVLDSPSYWNIA